MRKSIFAAFLVLLTAACSFGQTTRVELIEDIVGKYFDVYSLSHDKIGGFSIGSSYIDHFREDGLVRIIVFLPDGTQKTFDFDGRFTDVKPEKIESTSHTTARLSFAIGSSTLGITSTVYLSSHRPIAYQVWTIEKP